MKLLLTGFAGFTENQREKLENLGFDIEFLKDERQASNYDVSDVDCLVCNNLFSYKNIDEFKKLKFVQLISAGTDRIDTKVLAEKGIVLKNARGVYSKPIAEHIMMCVLCFYKNYHFYYENQKKAIWQKQRTVFELAGKNVLIFGTGSIACETAKRFSAFDCKVFGVNTSGNKVQYFDDVFKNDDFESVLKNSDIIVSTLPLSEDTKHFFNKDFFDKVKKESLFVNVSRGSVVDENSLLYALDENLIAGAVLDVFENEPLSETSELWKNKKVIVTPHNSFVGENNNSRLFALAYENLKSFLEEV